MHASFMHAPACNLSTAKPGSAHAKHAPCVPAPRRAHMQLPVASHHVISPRSKQHWLAPIVSWCCRHCCVARCRPGCQGPAPLAAPLPLPPPAPGLPSAAQSRPRHAAAASAPPGRRRHDGSGGGSSSSSKARVQEGCHMLMALLAPMHACRHAAPRPVARAPSAAAAARPPPRKACRWRRCHCQACRTSCCRAAAAPPPAVAPGLAAAAARSCCGCWRPRCWVWRSLLLRPPPLRLLLPAAPAAPPCQTPAPPAALSPRLHAAARSVSMRRHGGEALQHTATAWPPVQAAAAGAALLPTHPVAAAAG